MSQPSSIDLETLKSAETLLAWLHGKSLKCEITTVSQLLELSEFDLSNKKLTTIPGEVGCLYNLEELILNDNALTSLPPEIGKLTKLRILSASHNRLTNIPVELSKLSNLQSLNLWNNQLATLPQELGQLTKLIEFSISANRFTELPAWIGQLVKLQQLRARHNKIASIDKVDFSKFLALQAICLSNNILTNVPESLAQLPKSAQLDLDNNQLTQLPASLIQRHLDKTLIVVADGNPIKSSQLLTLPSLTTQTTSSNVTVVSLLSPVISNTAVTGVTAGSSVTVTGASLVKQPSDKPTAAIVPFSWDAPRWHWSIQNGWLSWYDNHNQEHAMQINHIVHMYIEPHTRTNPNGESLNTVALRIYPTSTNGCNNAMPKNFFYLPKNAHVVSALFNAIKQHDPHDASTNVTEAKVFDAPSQH